MKKIKQRIIDLDLSWKKELITFVAYNAILLVASIILALLFKNLIYGLFGLCFLVLLNFANYNRIGTLERKQGEEMLGEFVQIFTFFKVYIHNGLSVYTSLTQLKEFANDKLADYFQRLLDDIDQDKSVNPFIRFAQHFNELIIEEMMISIYQMVDDGNNSAYLTQFELIFDKFSEEMYKKELDSKLRGLSSMQTTPLIGSALLIVMITFGVINVIGEMINVL